MDTELFAESKLILLWGTNPLTSGHHIWKFINAAKKNGAHLVSIDPLRTRTSDLAHEHLAPLPGTDSALALGLLYVIVELGATNDAYIERRTLGWEQFKERILEFPPDRVARLTGLPEERIVELGRRVATTRPTAIRATMGIQRTAGGGATLRALYAIPGVTGDWDIPGGGASYSTSGHFRGNFEAVYRDDLLKEPVRHLTHTQLGEHLLREDDPPVKALVVYGANPMASNGNTNKVREGLLREDLFTVVMEQFPTDTVDYADIVLPATMQIENLDVHEGYGHLYLHHNAPAVEPPGECLSTLETFRRLARAMGLTEPALYEDDETIARALVGDDYDQLARDGWMRLRYPTPFLPYADGFPTPSGKLEFFSERAALDGHDPLPGFTPPEEPADAEHPLNLIAPASHWFLNSTFANKPDLIAKAGEPKIEIHPDDAAERGIEHGTRVRVFNARGAFEARAELSDRVRPGVIASTKGRWLKNVRGHATVNATVDERDADMGQGAVFHDNRVEVSRVDAPASERRAAHGSRRASPPRPTARIPSGA
jgi:anaerobic selenocysteine-containing dehydrogenase